MKKLLLATLLFGSISPTIAQIRLVKDIHAIGSSSPYILTALPDSTILFTADDDTHGRELWISDGTAAGTYMLKDITPGASGGMIKNHHINVNGKIYFAGSDGGGYHLWETDGTEQGTIKISDKVNLFDDPKFIWFNGKLYFSSLDNKTGRSTLWVSDGTYQGTQMLKDVFAGYNGYSFFSPVILSGKLYFGAKSANHGKEIWVTDGTANGTKMLKDLNPGFEDGLNGNLITYNNKIYFWGKENDNIGYELYSTDGNTINLIKDIYHGQGWKHPSVFYPLDNSIVFDGKLYFAAADNTGNRELWVTDGTANGTYMLKDINPGNTSGSDPKMLTVHNGLMLFSANDDKDYNRELWVSDGTVQGTKVLKEINPDSNGYSFSQPNPSITYDSFGVEQTGAKYNDSLYYFLGNDPKYGIELWCTDGTDSGTAMIQDYAYAQGNTYVNGIYAQGKNIWLSMWDYVYGYELFILDATYPLAVEHIAGKRPFKVFPNPAAGSITVDLGGEYFESGYLKIITATGVTVYDQTIAANQQIIKLNTAEFAAGTYLISVLLDGQPITNKVTIL